MLPAPTVRVPKYALRPSLTLLLCVRACVCVRVCVCLCAFVPQLTLRSLELTRLRLCLEVSRPTGSGTCTLKCSLSAGLALELPTPWFVPRMAIEAAGSLLLKVGLKIACDQILNEVQWLDKHAARTATKLNSRSPSHSPR